MKRLQLLLIPALLLVLLFAAAACAPRDTTDQPKEGTVTIALRGNQFDPDTLEVDVGDTVTFENEDSTAHRIVVGGDDLGEQQAGESKTWTASEAGTFEMVCTIHPDMTGEIKVGEGSTGDGGDTGGGSSSGQPPGGGTGTGPEATSTPGGGSGY